MEDDLTLIEFESQLLVFTQEEIDKATRRGSSVIRNRELSKSKVTLKEANA